MITIKLPPDLRRWLRVAAAERDLSLSAMVRSLIERERSVAVRRPLRAVGR